MIKTSMELRMVAWIQTNLHVTTASLRDEDIAMWEQLLLEDPRQAHAMAAYGFRRRQMSLYGHENITEDELAEYVQEFDYKITLAREGSKGIRLPLFEYSIRRIRLER